MADLPPPDPADVAELVLRHGDVISYFYRARAPRPGNVTSQLQALATLAAVIVLGTGGDAEEVGRFFLLCFEERAAMTSATIAGRLLKDIKDIADA